MKYGMVTYLPVGTYLVSARSARSEPPPRVLAFHDLAAQEPTFAGGAILAGTYVLTSATAYAGGTCTGTLSFPELAATYEFSGSAGSGTMLSSDRLQKGSATENKTGSGNYSTSGSMLTVVDTCGEFEAATSSFPYTATATSFTYDSTLAPGGFIQRADGSFCGHLVLTFAKM